METIESLEGIEIRLRFPPDTAHQIVQHPASQIWYGAIRSHHDRFVAVFCDRAKLGNLEVFLTQSQIRHALDSVARHEIPVFSTNLQPEDIVSNCYL
jgi:hypothetical protein